MREKSLVLLSSGLDSSYNLYRAFQETDVLMALTFDYGQRASQREARQAKVLTSKLGVLHKVVELPWFKDFTQSALVNREAKLPQAEGVEINSKEVSEQTAKAVWVPNRNGIFLNIAAGFSEGLGARLVIPGFNKEEASTFPDNSYEYMQSLDHAFSFSTANKVKVQCYSHELSKPEIVKKAKELNLPFHQLWPCYEDQSEWCGQCESCQRFFRALKSEGIEPQELMARQTHERLGEPLK